MGVKTFGASHLHLAETACIVAITIADGGMTTLLSPLLHAQGKDPAAIGLLVAVPAVIALLIRLPGGLLYTRQRARRLLMASLAVGAVGALLYPLSANPLILGLVGLVYGAGFSISTTVSMAVVIDSIRPNEDRGRVMSLYVAGMAFGYALGSFFGGFVGDHWGFRTAFAGMATISLLGILPVLSLAKPPAGPRRQPATGSLWTRAQNLAGALLDPLVVFIVIGAFFLNVFLTQFNTFMPLTLIPLGLTLAEIGAIRSVWSLTNAVTRSMGGPVLDRINPRQAQNGGLAVQAGILMLFSLPLPFILYVPLTMAAAFGRAVCYVANAVALTDVDPKRVSRGIASGIMNAAGDLGKIAGPVTGGFIARAAGVHHFWLIAPPLYLAVYAGVLLTRRQASRLKARPLTLGPEA